MKPPTDSIEIEQVKQRQKALAKVYKYLMDLDITALTEESCRDDKSADLNQELGLEFTNTEKKNG